MTTIFPLPNPFVWLMILFALYCLHISRNRAKYGRTLYSYTENRVMFGIVVIATSAAAIVSLLLVDLGLWGPIYYRPNWWPSFEISNWAMIFVLSLPSLVYIFVQSRGKKFQPQISASQ